MEISKNYFLFVLFICILSIGLGILTIMNVDKKFDGLIIDRDGGPLDIQKYFNTKVGKSYLSMYLNQYIKDDRFIKKNKPMNINNIRRDKNTLYYSQNNPEKIIFV